jgi:hypothetical protein
MCFAASPNCRQRRICPRPRAVASRSRQKRLERVGLTTVPAP